MLALASLLAPGVLADGPEPSIAASWRSGVEATLAAASVHVESSVRGDVQANLSAEVGPLAPRLGVGEPPREAASIEAPGPPVVGSVDTRVAWAAALLVLVAFGSALSPGLLGHAVIGLFSRIDRHALLEHPLRVGIHAAILQQPGITMKEIARSQAIGWGTAVYHLGRLEHGRLVVSQRHRQFRRFYDAHAGIRPAERDARAELIHPTSQRIVALVVQHPGSSQAAIADRVGITAPAAHKYLGRLERARLLTRQRDVKRVRYFPTQELLDLRRAAPTSRDPRTAT